MSARYNAGDCGLLEVGPEITTISGSIDSEGIAYDCKGARFTAHAGTRFDPHNPQHMRGSEGLRYAIGIQMARDRGDYAEADRIRARITSKGDFTVQNGPGFTKITRTARHP